MLIPFDVFPLSALEVSGNNYDVLRDRVNALLGEFECSKSPQLQNFARSKVSTYEKNGHTKTYIFITPDGNDDIAVPAFFSVGMTMLDMREATKSQKRKLLGNISSFDKTGAYCIAELARDDRFNSKQLPGCVILDKAIEVINNAKVHIGGRFVVVDSREEVFKSLYEPRGFRQISLAESPSGMEDIEFRTSVFLLRDTNIRKQLECD